MKLPIKALKQFAIKYGLSHVIVYAYATINKMSYVATYGRTIQDCDQAAQFGDMMKDALHWPESFHAVPHRVKLLQELLEKNALLEESYPRAFKLMRNNKHFLVIASHEPYYLKAYEMIREQEMKQGTWTDEDEALYKAAWQ